MKTTARFHFVIAVGAILPLLPFSARAGQEIQPPPQASADPKEAAAPSSDVRVWFPDNPPGFVTLGTQFSAHASGGYLDSITGIWAPPKRDAFLFMDSRYHLEDDGEFINSTGLGFRKLFREPQMIVGANAFWDSLDSRNSNHFDQLGLGAELLTRWVDFRFNGYLPDNSRYEVDRQTVSQTRESFGESASGRTITETTQTQTFKRYETGLEGFDSEVGFLIPKLDKYMEVRAFAGYYHFNNPFGHDFEGLKARLEARLLPGVFADLEYWNNAALMGGHWTAGFRVSVPFSIGNLVTGRNPFAGIGDSFRPRQRDFSERMGDMIIRAPRIQTVTSGEIPSGTSVSTRVRTGPLGAPSAPGSPAPVGGFPIE